jgi:hypothetical protein
MVEGGSPQSVSIPVSWRGIGAARARGRANHLVPAAAALPSAQDLPGRVKGVKGCGDAGRVGEQAGAWGRIAPPAVVAQERVPAAG